ncbi:MAG: hypothetical protein ACJAVR_002431 [Paracoccaceae bacterium]|jgi:uncharacterized protein (DUF2147 family)
MKYTLIAATILFATQASANEPFGVWQTITDDTGAYLLVDVQPCAADAAKLCSTVTEVINSPHQNLVGRPLFWDLEATDDNKWENGKVWDAATDKVYDAQVTLGKTAMRVEGCVSLFCDGQNWKRPQK